MITRRNDAWRFTAGLRPMRTLGALALLACLSGCYYYGRPYGYRDGYYAQPYGGYGGNYYNQPNYGGGYYGPPDEGGGGYGQPYSRGNSHTLPPLPYYGEEGG